MTHSRLRRSAVLLAASLLSFLALPQQSRAAEAGEDAGRFVGWAGLMGGLAVGLDDEPLLGRIFVQGGFGARLAGTPFVIDGGLAIGGGGGGRSRDYRPHEDLTGANVETSAQHIEVVPFVRGVYLVHDSVGLYLGAGAGWAMVHQRLSLHGDVFPAGHQSSQHDHEAHGLHSRSLALHGDDLPDGIMENTLALRLNAGVEFTMDGALRIFVEPLALHTYHLTAGTSVRLAFFAGVATVF